MVAVSPMTMPMPWSMNTPRPMRAPGWISIPVAKRFAYASARAESFQSRSQRAWLTRCSHRACTPGYTRATSSVERAAGSLARTARMSSATSSAPEMSFLAQWIGRRIDNVVVQLSIRRCPVVPREGPEMTDPLRLPLPRMPRWRRTRSRQMASYRVFDVCRVELEDGAGRSRGDAFTLRCPDWCNVIAVTPDEHVVMVWQYRFGTDALSLEIPGGVVDPGELPEQAARRELREETGYEVDDLESFTQVE